MMYEQVSRREREREFRREEIMRSASKLFSQKGFYLTTLDEIAEASEFGKGTIYNYFQGKEEIYVSIIEGAIKNTLQIVENADKNSVSFPSFLESYTKQFFNFCLENQDTYKIIVREFTRFDTKNNFLKEKGIAQSLEKTNTILKSRFAKAIKDSEIQKVEVEKILMFYQCLIHPYIHKLIHCKNDMNVDVNIDEHISFILQVFFNGILIKKY